MTFIIYNIFILNYYDIEDFNINRSWIKSVCMHMWEEQARNFREKFEPCGKLRVPWDGKMMSKISGWEKVGGLMT